jgi:Flp pilus assembly protein TadG
MQRVARGRGWYRRRATVIVQVAMASTLMLGMGALAVDVGILYTAKSELQVSADAAALAAAAELAGSRGGDVRENAIAAADRFAQLNKVMGVTPRVLPDDVEFGRATPSGAAFRFAPADSNWDAVRVTIRHMESGEPDNPAALDVPLALARVFGVSREQLQARASAVLVPRDIAVVIDLSGSMNDDSELQHYKRYQGERGQWRNGIHVNLRDIWCALDGPAPARPYVPGAEGQTQYAGDSGPAIGAMNTWGNPVVPETYSPSSDPGLWYIPKGSTCNVAAARTSLVARGYSTDEINCLFSGAKDSTTNPPQYVNRTAVILGLATWNSGRTGGRPGGNGDVYVDNSELSWTAYPSWRQTWTWKNYIDYVSSSSTAVYRVNSAFRYRYGLKTFVNFLLENQPQYNQTAILYQTPEQPVQAVKDAVQALVDEIESLESMDQLSLEIFATTARHEVDLTLDLQSVANRLYQMQAGHYDTCTNMGGGLQRAIAELTSARARAAAAKVILLMSDGKPNVDAQGVYRGFSADIDAWVRSVARQAADMNMRIYTISVGSDADLELMASLAQIGHGEYFHAEGTPAEYAEQLDEIFRTLGGKRPVQLIE